MFLEKKIKFNNLKNCNFISDENIKKTSYVGIYQVPISRQIIVRYDDKDSHNEILINYSNDKKKLKENTYLEPFERFEKLYYNEIISQSATYSKLQASMV